MWENEELMSRRVPVNGVRCTTCGELTGCHGYIVYRWCACLCPKCADVSYFVVDRHTDVCAEIPMSPCRPQWLNLSVPELIRVLTSKQRAKIRRLERQWDDEKPSAMVAEARAAAKREEKNRKIEEEQARWEYARRETRERLERERRAEEWKAEAAARKIAAHQKLEWDLAAQVEATRRRLLKQEKKLADAKKASRSLSAKVKVRSRVNPKVKLIEARRVDTLRRVLHERAALKRRIELGDVVGERAPTSLIEEVVAMFHEVAGLRGMGRPLLAGLRRETGSPQTAGLV
jgi:hypothetical protein